MKNKKRNLNDNNYLDGIIAETLGLPIEHFWDQIKSANLYAPSPTVTAIWKSKRKALKKLPGLFRDRDS